MSDGALRGHGYAGAITAAVVERREDRGLSLTPIWAIHLRIAVMPRSDHASGSRVALSEGPGRGLARNNGLTHGNVRLTLDFEAPTLVHKSRISQQCEIKLI